MFFAFLNAATGYNQAMLVTNLTLADQGLDAAMRSLLGHGLIVVILVACMVGLVVIVLLLRAWRRFNERLNRPRPDRQAIPDIWRASAERLKDTDQPEADEYDPDDTDRPVGN